MSIILELRPEVEATLRAEAARRGQPLEALLQTWIEEKVEAASPFAKPPSLRDAPGQSVLYRLLRMSPEERRQHIAAAVDAAADEYEADLALPVAQRELTAFSALDGDPFFLGEKLCAS